MSTEHEIERMVVRLLGDGSLYTKMCDDAVKGTEQAAKKITFFGSMIERTQKTLEAFGRTLTRVGTNIRSLGTLASVGITAPITALAGVATNEFNQFESALSRMKGLVGLNDETILQFRDHILDLAKATGKAPVELARAMENITSSGVQGAAAIETLDISARAAAGGLGEVRAVSDTVTSAMNAYGVANLSATKATDILVAAVREGKAEAETFAPVLGNVLPIANEMGISFDEAAGSIAYLTLATGSAATAATQYQNILAQTLKLNPDKEAGKNLTKMGIDVKAFQKAVGDEGLLPSLMKLKEELAKTGHTLKDAFPDVQAMTAALQLTGANSEKATSVLANVANAAGSVDTAFNAAAETTQFKLNQAMADLKTIMIELGEIVAPIMMQWVNVLGGLRDVWKSLTPASKQLVVNIAMWATVIGPVLVGLGTFTVLLGSLMTGAGGLVAFVGTLATAVPYIVLIGVNIVAWGSVLSNFVDTTTLWGDAVGYVTKQWKALVDYFMPAIQGIVNAFKAGDLELAMKIFATQVQLTFMQVKLEVLKIWGDVKLEVSRIWADTCMNIALGWKQTLTDMEIAYVIFRNALKGRTTHPMDQELQDIRKKYTDFVDTVGENKAKFLGGIREYNKNALVGPKDQIFQLKHELEKQTKLADYLAKRKMGMGAFEAANATGLANDPALKEAEKALSEVQDKAKIKMSLEFDAAGKGSTEALARISSYRQALGLGDVGPARIKAPKADTSQLAFDAFGQALAQGFKAKYGPEKKGGFSKMPEETPEFIQAKANWLEFKAIFERIAKGVEKDDKVDGLVQIVPANFNG